MTPRGKIVSTYWQGALRRYSSFWKKDTMLMKEKSNISQLRIEHFCSES